MSSSSVGDREVDKWAITESTPISHIFPAYDRRPIDSTGVRDLQRAGGVLDHAVLRTGDDPNMVVVVHTFESSDAAHAFFGDNPDLKDAMGNAGARLS